MMEHTEKVLEEMLENLFAVNMSADFDGDSCEGDHSHANQDYDTFNGSISMGSNFDDDVDQFFNNLQKTYCETCPSSCADEATDQTPIPSSEEHINGRQSSTCTLKNVQNYTIAEELKRMHTDFPINAENNAETPLPYCDMSESLNTTPEAMTDLPISIQNDDDKISPQNSSTDFSQKAGNDALLNEVKRALYGEKSEDFPEDETPEYYDVAQEYAVYGCNFLDFPTDLEFIFEQVKQKHELENTYEQTLSGSENNSLTPEFVPSNTSLQNDATSTSDTEIWNSEQSSVYTDESAESVGTVATEVPTYSGNSNRPIRTPQTERVVTANNPLSIAATAGAATAATYYQLCTNLQPALRPVRAVNAAAAAVAVNANTAYNMLLNNKVTYLASGTHNVPQQQVFYNQQQLSTTTNYFANNVNQVALGTAANLRFPNSVLATTTTQHISNTVVKETQYLANVPAVTGAVGVNVYERLVYAQKLQQQIFQTRQQQQQQQQAMVAAVMFQQQLQRQHQQQQQQPTLPQMPPIPPVPTVNLTTINSNAPNNFAVSGFNAYTDVSGGYGYTISGNVDNVGNSGNTLN